MARAVATFTVRMEKFMPDVLCAMGNLLQVIEHADRAMLEDSIAEAADGLSEALEKWRHGGVDDD